MKRFFPLTCIIIDISEFSISELFLLEDHQQNIRITGGIKKMEGNKNHGGKVQYNQFVKLMISNFIIFFYI